MNDFIEKIFEEVKKADELAGRKRIFPLTPLIKAIWLKLKRRKRK